MRFRTLSCAVALSLSVVACSTNQPVADASSVRASIEAANKNFIDAFKRGDKTAMMASYAEDAVIMMPNEEAWHGREAAGKGFDALLAQTRLKEGAAKTEDVMVAGDLAVETGTYAWTLQPKTGAEVKDKGKYLTVWRRQGDGTWKIVRDINNSDLSRLAGYAARPVVVVQALTTLSGVSWPYDMKQLKAQTVADLKEQDAVRGRFDIVADTPSDPNTHPYVLSSEVLSWEGGNRAKRTLLPGLKAGDEAAEIRYWLNDDRGSKVFEHKDVFRADGKAGAGADSVGRMAHPLASKMAERLADAK